MANDMSIDLSKDRQQFSTLEASPGPRQDLRFSRMRNSVMNEETKQSLADNEAHLMRSRRDLHLEVLNQNQNQEQDYDRYLNSRRGKRQR